MLKVISWNLLRLVGASLGDVVRLVLRERPDLLLLQEATPEMDGLPEAVGGTYLRTPLPGRIHGLAAWSSAPFPAAPSILPLPSGAMFDRVAQILTLPDFAVANVHLSHGQVLNRRQLRRIAEVLPSRAAVLGDYNLVGPAFLPGFADVGPRVPTHIAGDVVPLRIDRCLVRGLACVASQPLSRGTSDHRPILVELKPVVQQPARKVPRHRGFHWSRAHHAGVAAPIVAKQKVGSPS